MRFRYGVADDPFRLLLVFLVRPAVALHQGEDDEFVRHAAVFSFQEVAILELGRLYPSEAFAPGVKKVFCTNLVISS